MFQADNAFGTQHYCLTKETILHYELPLILDTILKQQYNAILNQHLLMFQLLYIEKLPNMKLDLFGQVGYMTTKSKNVEAILYTNFDSKNQHQILNILRFKLS